MTGFALSIHLMAVVPAIGLGAIILARPKGTRLHRALGRSWSGLVLIAVLSSLGIRTEQGDFTYPHLLILLTAAFLLLALRAIRKRRIQLHRTFMLCCFTTLLLGEAVGLAPGQLFHSLLFSQW